MNVAVITDSRKKILNLEQKQEQQRKTFMEENEQLTKHVQEQHRLGLIGKG